MKQLRDLKNDEVGYTFPWMLPMLSEHTLLAPAPNEHRIVKLQKQGSVYKVIAVHDPKFSNLLGVECEVAGFTKRGCLWIF